MNREAITEAVNKLGEAVQAQGVCMFCLGQENDGTVCSVDHINTGKDEEINEVLRVGVMATALLAEYLRRIPSDNRAAAVMGIAAEAMSQAAVKAGEGEE